MVSAIWFGSLVYGKIISESGFMSLVRESGIGSLNSGVRISESGFGSLVS